MTKYKIGDRVQAKNDSKASGVVVSVFEWNNPNGYKGNVYEFKNGYGQTFCQYKEEDIELIP